MRREGGREGTCACEYVCVRACEYVCVCACACACVCGAISAFHVPFLGLKLSL